MAPGAGAAQRLSHGSRRLYIGGTMTDSENPGRSGIVPARFAETDIRTRTEK